MIRDINSRSGAYCRIDRSGALPMLNIFGSGDVIERVMELIDEIIIKSDPTWTGGMSTFLSASWMDLCSDSATLQINQINFQ